ncbi:MAG: hypothetical protein HRU19_16730 [Pseudobacteriovorax sp.]|nr:hypothetical protein [Pseudobacteriovorax sp.]
MRTIILLTAALSFNTAFGESRFEQMEVYREILKLSHIEGKKKEALDLATELQTKLDRKDDLYQKLDSLRESLGAKRSKYPLEPALAFITGTKTNIYCRNVGLVHMSAEHNDGTKSSLKLVSSNRKMNNSYSLVVGGDWVYELDTDYREPVKSEAWIDESTETSYKIREYRQREKGLFEAGNWTTSWSGSKFRNRSHTTGNAPEPLPMFMAQEYHRWGEFDLGFPIDFKVGFEDTAQGEENIEKARVVLRSERKVTKALNQYMFTDSSMQKHQYFDCFEVFVKIGIENLVTK